VKQLLQDLQSGELIVADIPVPSLGPGQVLIQTNCSLISAGTERMLNSFASANYLNKVRQQPHRVKEVLDKARTDGIVTTLEAVQTKLGEPIPLGYCNAGTVIAVGADIDDLVVGDRVASSGAHAEVVSMPRNLVAKIPDGVDFETAAYTVISSIALQGVRLIAPTIGERVAVFGLGLVGLLAVQTLRANGCQVIGFDFVEERVELARSFGATGFNLADGFDPVLAATEFSAGLGVDAVLVTASTASNDLMSQAAQMSRQRGRIVLTGVVGLDLKREDFYEKELQFSVSCSYGPGRYDSSYENDGHDYPVGFVRWTEQRNFEAVLDLMADGGIVTTDLTTNETPFAQVTSAYDALQSGNDIGIVLRYDTSAPAAELLATQTVQITTEARSAVSQPTIGLIGAGAFTNGVMLPALKDTPARLKYVASSGGTSGSVLARKFGIERSTTDSDLIFGDDDVDAVVISTRHNSHARFVTRALESDKAVFVEKPLAIDRDGLAQVFAAYARAAARGVEPWVMVGFNRRFAPTTVAMTNALKARQGPVSAVFTANAGSIPADHWTQDPAAGGGRIIGEACHYIDYLVHLIGSPIVTVSAHQATGTSADSEDIVSINLGFADGSIGTVHYFSNGAKALPKERCEVFFDGNVLQMNNFKTVKGFGKVKLGRRAPATRQEKGHKEQFAAVVQSLQSGAVAPIPFSELVNVTQASFAALDSLRSGGQVQRLASP